MPLSPQQGNRHSQLIIKFCGICRLEDARMAAEAGATALGIMQVPSSPRYLPLQQATELSSNIRDTIGTKLKIIAVIADATEQQITDIIDNIKPDMLQFHGDEIDEFCVSFALPYIKAIRATTAEEIRQQATKHPSATHLLLDSLATNNSFGGSGETFDWEQIPAEAKLANRLIIAGGLNPNNLAELLRKIIPGGVDVSSGIEHKPGMKDVKLMNDFVGAIRSFLGGSRK